MKKVIILVLAMLFLLSACTDAPKEVTSQKEETSKEVVEEENKNTPTPEPTSEPTAEPTPESLPMKVAVVVCRDGYAPSELHPVMGALADAGYEPLVVSDMLGDAEGFEETTPINAVLTDFSGSDLRGIVVIGGSASLWDNVELHRLLNEVAELDRVTAGICLNSVALAKAGVIGEGDTACWFNCDIADPEMKAAGIEDSGKPVTVNGNIITGDGPDAVEEFASEVVKALDGM